MSSFTDESAATRTLVDGAQWDGKRWRFWIGPTEHGGPDRLTRGKRTRTNGGQRVSFCEVDNSFQCIVRREVSGKEARAFAFGTVAATR